MMLTNRHTTTFITILHYSYKTEQHLSLSFMVMVISVSSSVAPSYYYKSRSLIKRKWSLLHSPRLYHTSISPLSVRTSMIVCPRKSSDSRLNFCLTRDLMSSSSSHTRTFIRSEELWHSLKTHIRLGLIYSNTTTYLLGQKLVY